MILVLYSTYQLSFIMKTSAFLKLENLVSMIFEKSVHSHRNKTSKVCLAFAFAGAAGPVSADTYSWFGGSGSWNQASNWAGGAGSFPNAAGDTAILSTDLAGGRSINLNQTSAQNLLYSMALTMPMTPTPAQVSPQHKTPNSHHP